MENQQGGTAPQSTARNGVRHTNATRAKLLEEFRRVGRVDLACAAAGCDRDSHYRWMKKFPKYAADFEEAQKQALGLLEDEATRRAYHGTMKPVSVGGQVVMVTEFSDRLMEFLLKCRGPEKYGERRELNHKGDLTVKRLIGVSEDEI